MSEEHQSLNEEVKDELATQRTTKSSMEILSELFSTFDAEPPVIVKKEKETNKKHRKGKKKHKHKEKKHAKGKRKERKKRIDFADLLIKTESDGNLSIADTLNQIISIKTEKDQQNNTELEVKEETVSAVVKNEVEESELSTNNLKKMKDKKTDNAKDAKCKNKTDKSQNNDEEKRLRRKKHKLDKCSEEKSSKRSRRNRSKSKTRSRSRSASRRNEFHEWRKQSPDRRNAHRYDDDKGEKNDRYWRRSRDRSRSPRHKDDFYNKCDRNRKCRTEDRSSKDKSFDLRHKLREESRYKDDSKKHSIRDDSHKDCNDEKRFKDRVRTSKTSESETSTVIDKKKLLEIARKNAIQMAKSGSLPNTLPLTGQAQENVIAAIRCGGKTVAELTDFCKSLSKQEEIGELSSVSSESESDGEMKLHHPFLIKEKPLIMNIKNSVPLPTKTNQERASELRLQFPVSSGQQHRKTESEWVAVSPKKVETPVKPQQIAPAIIPEATTKATHELRTVPAAKNAPPGPQVFPAPIQPAESEQIVAAIVGQRLAAMRRLQENPNDCDALKNMNNAQEDMNVWAESRLIGQFTGSTGVQVLSQAELAAGHQAWARKDQLQTAAPLSGGMGMHLLQKMGWRPGEGLGKEKSGALEPLLLEVKLDKKGIVAREEGKKKVPIPKVTKQAVMTLQGKHPVSLLGEFASKKKLGAPEYVLDFECGPDHMKNFLFKVQLNGIEYKPNVASGNKKEAKAVAATICLQALGLLP